jgi:DNA repair protein RadC
MMDSYSEIHYLVCDVFGLDPIEKLPNESSLSKLLSSYPPLVPKWGKIRSLLQYWLVEELIQGDLMQQSQQVKEYLRLQLSEQKYESFWILCLNTQNRLIHSQELFRGTLNQTAIYPREIVKLTLEHNAAAVILAHNHPSGVAEPSTADERLTKTIQKALSVVEVKVLDHFIVAGSHCLSFSEQGLM